MSVCWPDRTWTQLESSRCNLWVGLSQVCWQFACFVTAFPPRLSLLRAVRSLSKSKFAKHAAGLPFCQLLLLDFIRLPNLCALVAATHSGSNYLAKSAANATWAASSHLPLPLAALSTRSISISISISISTPRLVFVFVSCRVGCVVSEAFRVPTRRVVFMVITRSGHRSHCLWLWMWLCGKRKQPSACGCGWIHGNGMGWELEAATRCLSHFTSTQIILCAVYADTWR